MSKVAVITMGVKLDGEKGYTRFRYLCEFLVKKGYEVRSDHDYLSTLGKKAKGSGIC